MLDSVICEFDDGLLSSADTESVYGHARIEAEIRKRPPPKAKNLPSNLRTANQHHLSSQLSLNDKIDDIFSELTEEIYSADKHQKIISMHRSESTNSNGNARKLSPVRRFNDPLPNPPSEDHQTNSSR